MSQIVRRYAQRFIIHLVHKMKQVVYHVNTELLIRKIHSLRRKRIHRKTFFGIVLLLSVILYFRNRLNNNIKVITFSEKSIPEWTWLCTENNICERTMHSKGVMRASLETCTVLCSSLTLWPQPTGSNYVSDSIVPINTNFSLEIAYSPSEQVSTHLKDAFALFKQDVNKLLGQHKVSAKHSVGVHVSVKHDADPRLRLDTDESYEIYITPAEDSELDVLLTANSFCGARHGFETLSQLIWFDPLQGSLFTIDTVTITDKPIFHYRGLMLDTARNYFPVSDILRTIDAMASTKLNTFHWHATDSQSFPLMLNSTVELAKHGAYGHEEIYTTEDVQKIVRHARVRGIRVLIEVDAPAHVGSAWSWGRKNRLEDLVYCVAETPWKRICGEPPCGQLNPKNSHVIYILKAVYAEIIQLTGVDDVFHLGGDEVFPRCWEKYISECADACDTVQIWMDFMGKAYTALKQANGGKVPNMTIVWSSDLIKFKDLKNQFTVQNWNLFDNEEVNLKEGYRVVLSNVNDWFFDCGFGSWRNENASHCGRYKRWKEVYYQPMSAPRWDVVGGEGCMWSEQVGPTDLDTRLWPRAAALGERLWTNPQDEPNGTLKKVQTEKVQQRLDLHRARLVARGIRAAPLFPRWCSQNPYKCAQIFTN